MLPPLELNYIKPSPSRTAKVRIIAFVPLREGVGGGHHKAFPAGETRVWAYIKPAAQVSSRPGRRPIALRARAAAAPSLLLSRLRRS